MSGEWPVVFFDEKKKNCEYMNMSTKQDINSGLPFIKIAYALSKNRDTSSPLPLLETPSCKVEYALPKTNLIKVPGGHIKVSYEFVSDF
jgi:hypothetical protein